MTLYSWDWRIFAMRKPLFSIKQVDDCGILWWKIDFNGKCGVDFGDCFVFWVVLDLASAGRRLKPKTYLCWMWCVWPAYLLGLLAKIKCSICSYQLNLWYSRQCLVEINLISRRGLQTVLALDVDMCDFGPALLPWSLTSAFFKTNQFVLLLRFFFTLLGLVLLWLVP